MANTWSECESGREKDRGETETRRNEREYKSEREQIVKKEEPGESARAARETRRARVAETARCFIDGGGVMDRYDIIALRRSAPNRIRVQGAAGCKVQRAHPSALRHALRGPPPPRFDLLA